MRLPGDLVSLTPQRSLSQQRDSVPTDNSSTRKLTDDFAVFLRDSLNQVETSQRDAQEKMRLFAAGEIDDVHDVTIAQQKAQLGLRLTTIVRNKLIEAYERLSQMQ